MRSYTFLAARYMNKDNTAVIALTKEIGRVALSAVDTPDHWLALQSSGIAVLPYQPPAPAERYLIPKFIIIQRLVDFGFIETARAALESDSSLYARWWSPDKHELYQDEPEALALLQAIGADPALIMAPVGSEPIMAAAISLSGGTIVVRDVENLTLPARPANLSLSGQTITVTEAP